ncbi:hypothetical protein [Paenibacillus sp. ISL-20]|uniref:hypothetical protein n=1 Tax=Paenibacillus sp. ISL-20 TaxID=2819163 RepID=UPI001BEC015C|nr:hypothetical protein [Paenibacillus sp. ISL-20]MBT2759971.1 hypothetical protein [Paenibacillus sp. ISL-20]
MNLYKIMFTHYSPKDSEEGIIIYLAANSHEEVYEWLKSEPQLSNGNKLFNTYKYNENDNKTYEIYGEFWNVIGEETFKERMIRLHGEMFDEEKELDDLYYGLTLYGWELIKEDVKPDVLKMIKDYGIQIEQFK